MLFVNRTIQTVISLCYFLFIKHRTVQINELLVGSVSSTKLCICKKLYLLCCKKWMDVMGKKTVCLVDQLILHLDGLTSDCVWRELNDQMTLYDDVRQ